MVKRQPMPWPPAQQFHRWALYHACIYIDQSFTRWCATLDAYWDRRAQCHITNCTDTPTDYSTGREDDQGSLERSGQYGNQH